MPVKIIYVETEKPVKNVNVTFNYKGFDISISNVFRNQESILVFTRYNQEVATEKPLHTVEDAIILVDNMLSETNTI